MTHLNVILQSGTFSSRVGSVSFTKRKSRNLTKVMNIFPLFFWTFLSFAQLALCYVHPLEACNTETKKNKTEAICVL